MVAVGPDSLVDLITARVPTSDAAVTPSARQLADVAAQIGRLFQPQRVVLYRIARARRRDGR